MHTIAAPNQLVHSLTYNELTNLAYGFFTSRSPQRAFTLEKVAIALPEKN